MDVHAPPLSEPELDPFGALVSRFAPQGGKSGPLADVRLCVKDNIEVEGQAFTAGHSLFGGKLGQRTAPVVERLLGAGAELVGMSHTDSGGFGMISPTVRNPVFPGRTVGGSSGGAAAAVSGGLADLGLGTDTGGSIRIPAACTGLFGFKPSYGRLSFEGIWPLAPSFDHAGLLARDLTLLRRAAECLLPAEEDAIDARPLTIAVERTAPPYQDCLIAVKFKEILVALQSAGHKVIQYDLPDRQAFARAFGALVLAEATEIYADVSADERSQLGPAAQRALAIPLRRAEVDLYRLELEVMRRQYEACLQTCDVLISPTLYIPLPAQGLHTVETDDMRRSVLQIFLSATCFCNFLGNPALAMPIESELIPFNLHLAVRGGRDLEAFGIAERLLAAIAR